MSAAGFAERSGREAGRGAGAKAAALMTPGKNPVSDASGRWNGAQWKGQPVERFTPGTEMERSGDALNWRRQDRHRLPKKCK